MILDKKQFARIERHLAAAPEGMTTAEIIEKLDLSVRGNLLSARLGKMFMYGKIDRETVRHSTGGGHVTRWKTKTPLAGDRADVTANNPPS
jgi:hypothetical protein